MALPKLEHPAFELVLPSTGKKIYFRPFLVKEEKILLIAKESRDKKDIIRAIKQVIQNCIVSGDVHVDKMASFDIEYFFIKLRSKSVNNIIDIQIIDPETKESILHQINLDELEIQKNEKHSSTVKLNDEILIKLKYPTFETLEQYAESISEKNSEFEYELVKKSIDTVFVGDEGIKFENQDPEEQDVFLESMNREHWKKIQEFFVTMPKLSHPITYTNKKGKDKTVYLEGINDFFV